VSAKFLDLRTTQKKKAPKQLSREYFKNNKYNLKLNILLDYLASSDEPTLEDARIVITKSREEYYK
jgi:hypothetical protein